MDFKKLVEDRHEYARDWKARTGGKVVGWYEPYFSEELAIAAGLLPVRVLARHEPDDIADKYIYCSCYPVRDLTNQFLKGRYDYLDGIVCVEGCQWMYNAWQVAVNVSGDRLFNHYIFLPDYVDAMTSKHIVRKELEVFKSKLEEWTGKTITDEALDEAIAVCNENRLLLRRIYEMRRQDRPVISGSEMMNIILASQVTDKAEMNGILERFIEEAEARTPGPDRIRLMLIGSETWDTSLEEMAEEAGAVVVADELDSGSNYIWNNVILSKDRLMALALRYLGRPHNALKDNNWRRRPQRIFELAEDYNVDGVIIAKQIYCHLYGTDNYITWKLLRERNIPYHFMERGHSLPVEETQMRLETFLNMLKPGLNHLQGWHKTFGE